VSVHAEGTVTLRDGRRLGWAEHGARGGAGDGRAGPIVWHHGTPGSRLSFLGGDAASRLGVRVIVLERPGFGRSDALPGRRIVDWPRDLEEAADALGLGRFAIAGMSGAGPYLLAAGRALGDRVTRVTMVGCAGPFHARGAVRAMATSRRAFLALVRRSPRAAERVLDLVYGSRHESFYRAMTRGLGDADGRVLAQQDVWRLLVSATSEALRGGYSAFVAEVALASGDWGVPFAEVHVPVALFHGTDDRSTPLAMATHMAERLPDATLEVLPGEGHFLLATHAERILRAASA
jgi:pimeloyl-ACP methyl ester carboxylesterase